MIFSLLFLVLLIGLAILENKIRTSCAERKALLLAYAKGDIHLMNRAIRMANARYKWSPSDEDIMVEIDRIRNP